MCLNVKFTDCLVILYINSVTSFMFYLSSSKFNILLWDIFVYSLEYTASQIVRSKIFVLFLQSEMPCTLF